MTALEKHFEKLNIDYDSIAFYDSKEFLKQEQIDNKFLDLYARYVNQKQYSTEYIERAKREIPFIAKILNQELIKDGRLGACIDVSLVLSRILEKEGYWNYLTKGSLTINYPKESELKTNYFWSVDIGEFQSGHTWVVSPPFNVIDIALKQQIYKNNEQDYLPDTILNEDYKVAKISENDIISPNVLRKMDLQGIRENRLSCVRDDFFEFIEKFPAILVENNKLECKYSTVAISAPDETLERITSLKLNDKYGIEIYNEIIKPRLVEYRKTV